MATTTAVKSGDHDDTTMWDGGVVPPGGNDVALAGFTCTVTNGDTTNIWASCSGGSLTIKDGGTVKYSGDMDFAAGETFEMEGGATAIFDGANGANVQIEIDGATLNIHGTSGNMAMIQSVDASHKADLGLVISGTPTITALEYLEMKWHDIVSLYFQICEAPIRGVNNIHIHDGDTRGVYSLQAEVTITNLCVHGCGRGISASRSVIRGSNWRLGEDLDGNADANTLYDIGLVYDSMTFLLDHARLESGTQVDSTHEQGMCVSVMNLGANNADGIITRRGAPGTDKIWRFQGTIEDSGANKLLTANSDCSAANPLILNEPGTHPFVAQIPVTGDDTVAMSVSVTLNAQQPNDSVRLVLDPYNVYGAYDISTEVINGGNSGVLTVSGSVTWGGDWVGKLPWEIRVIDYGAGGTATVTAASKTTTVGSPSPSPSPSMSASPSP